MGKGLRRKGHLYLGFLHNQADTRQSCLYRNDSITESRRIKAKLSESERRLSELDALISKLYEDWVAGRINEMNFTRMMEKAQTEQL